MSCLALQLDDCAVSGNYCTEKAVERGKVCAECDLHSSDVSVSERFNFKPRIITKICPILWRSDPMTI